MVTLAVISTVPGLVTGDPAVCARGIDVGIRAAVAPGDLIGAAGHGIACGVQDRDIELSGVAHRQHQLRGVDGHPVVGVIDMDGAALGPGDGIAGCNDR